MKKLTMINILVAFLLLCGCAPHTSINDTKSNLDNLTDRDAKSNLNNLTDGCVTKHSNMERSDMKLSNTSSFCIYSNENNQLPSMKDGAMKDGAHNSAISITDCDTNDYSVNVLGKITNNPKIIIRSESASHWFFPSIGESKYSSNVTIESEQGEIERCIALFDGKVSTDFYFKVRNCQTLFDCSLEIVTHNNEFAIGPFTSGNEILRRTNKKE